MKLDFNYLNFTVSELYNRSPISFIIKGIHLNNFNFPEMIRVYIQNKELRKKNAKIKQKF